MSPARRSRLEAMEARKPSDFWFKTPLNRVFDALKRSAADEQDIGRVNLHIFLLGMLAPALRRDIGDGAFEYLQVDACWTPSPDTSRVIRRAFRLAGDLVNLVNVDDAALGVLHHRLDVLAVVGGLEQLQQDVFHVFADIARFRERSRVGNRERDVQNLRKGLGKQRFAAAGRAEQQNVGLFCSSTSVDWELMRLKWL